MIRQLILCAAACSTVGCTTFTTVRSAEIAPGASWTLQGSTSTKVGDDAGWFYSADCSSDCSRSVAATDFVWTHGAVSEKGGGATLGFGLSGLFPYAEGYVQLGTSKTVPFGVGGRLGLPFGNWREHRVYGRVDLVRGKTRFLWNPGVVITTGNSPNGSNASTMLGIANGFGLELDEENAVLTPSISIVRARAERTSYGTRIGPSSSTFLTAGLSMTFRRR